MNKYQFNSHDNYVKHFFKITQPKMPSKRVKNPRLKVKHTNTSLTITQPFSKKTQKYANKNLQKRSNHCTNSLSLSYLFHIGEQGFFVVVPFFSQLCALWILAA